MERAGAEDIGTDAERKGLGTPATWADIIEKLVKDGYYIRREKRRIIPTEDGIRLTAMFPDVMKSPKLTMRPATSRKRRMGRSRKFSEPARTAGGR